jgi:hypothetical protein
LRRVKANIEKAIANINAVDSSGILMRYMAMLLSSWKRIALVLDLGFGALSYVEAIL